ncbi:MAG: ferrous iron transport protein A [Candidatus Omnitrophica bacterium]|nr:ferrous iron transport protein A [Candidatus Omnitrophota bacterium]
MPSDHVQNPVSLGQLPEGSSGVVLEFTCHNAILHRLRELGMTRGTQVAVKRLAPFGDPMEITVRGFNVSIRRADASCIVLEKIETR